MTAPTTVTRTLHGVSFFFLMLAVLVGIQAANLLADGPEVVNVNYYGGSKPGNADMSGYYATDASARGTASLVAPLNYGGNIWNDFNGNGASTNLLDSVGVSSGIGFSTSMGGGPWNDWTGLGVNRMLVSGLVASYPTYSNILGSTGLKTNTTYNLYIASLHNNNNNPSDFRMGIVEKHLANSPGGSTTWMEGINYVRFLGLSPASNGTLVVEAKSTAQLTLNGFQLMDATPQKKFTSFTFPPYGPATISGTNISMALPYGSSVTALSPTYTLSYGATCVPASGSTQDFTGPVQYSVIASDNTTQEYSVAVSVRPFPDPVFTLTPSTFLWDGRSVMTVLTNISNWSTLVATGGTNLTYKWSISIAVTKMITPGLLTLTRSQGSGPMVVTLVLSNGGFRPATNSVIVTVQEPTNDAWVVRTPGATEKAVHNQFYARDDTGFGTLYYNGNQPGSSPTVFVNIYTNGGGADILYTNIVQTLVGGAYAITAKIPAGLITHKVEYGTNDAVLATVTNIVCGDAYLIDGQSNAEAVQPNNGTPPESSYYRSAWIRSFGNYYSGSTAAGWGTAVRTYQWGTGNYGNHTIGCWGMVIASNLFNKYKMPICIINGAVGGTRIDQHMPGGSIYFNISNRVNAAKLSHGIRAVLWHQGEQDQGSEGPDGDYDYIFYQQYFMDLSAAWKQDFPNIKFYYIYQIWPAACGDTSRNDELREVHRTLPHLYSNMRIMSTLGTIPGSGCHYDMDGYAYFAKQMSLLVEKDNYGLVPSAAITAPAVQKAYFTTTNRTQIALEFGQDMRWNNVTAGHMYLDGVAGKVSSGSVAGKVIKLQLTGYSTAQTITYLKGIGWDSIQSKLLYGSNGIAALTFANVSIDPLPPVRPYVDITNIVGTTNVPSDTASIDIIGTNNAITVDMWWNNSGGGGGTLDPVPGQWNFAVTLAPGTNIITVNGSNTVGTVTSDSVTVNVIPEPAAAVATAAVWCCLLEARKRTR